MQSSQLNIDFPGGSSNVQTINLVLNGQDNIFGNLHLEENRNTLILSETSSTTTIKDGLLIQGGNGITFDVKDGANLTFNQGVTNLSQDSPVFKFSGTSTVRGAVLAEKNA